ncbi:MAG: patatin-like phospholipase family protein [Verrucomicrobia bacterium]|nr:patatin-like phospholipase family protein [Verrucomicrobiota bacterium]MBU4290752.1 patatin-like phospholipase family protein [Verrucomicrobiota bacterium]MBU4428685.1 patatin-like phospholipase family protein [Verrucomicrobiota bacterium]MCG2679770.1 patatin-like phospholipase family protein [Kiritimatiellia bacterium]
MHKIGLALGGGGAKGLAHIPMLEVFDDLGIQPYRIAGTSMGSIIGALYASGIEGGQIRQSVQNMIIAKGESFREALRRKDVRKWIKFIDLEFGPHALFKGDRFIDFLYQAMGVSTFDALKIPLRVVATDFWTSKQVVLESGKLLPAVKASMALPGVFTPVVMRDRILIDGGGVNPVPHDLLDDCDVVVAVNVMGRMSRPSREVPNLFRAVLGMFDILQNSIIAEKLKINPPDIYVKPDITGVDILEFHRAGEIFAQAEPAKRKLRKDLMRLLKSH